MLLDADGNEIDKSGLKLSFESTMITVPISKIKTVDLNVVLNNAPVTSPLKYKLDVTSVSVIGAPAVIDALESVDLLPIDFGQITADNTEFQCKLNLPAGVRVNDGLETVTVTFEFVNIRSKGISVSHLNYTDFDTKLGSVKLNTPLRVTVYGLKDEINKLSSSDLTLNISLADYDAAGSYTVPATVTVSDTFKSVWVSTYNKEYSAYITIG